MGEIISMVLKILVRLSFVLAGIVGFIILLNMGLSMVTVGLNQGALTDIINLVQVWLPFNINVVLMWLWTAGALYMTYRMALVAFSFINRLAGKT